MTNFSLLYFLFISATLVVLLQSILSPISSTGSTANFSNSKDRDPLLGTPAPHHNDPTAAAETFLMADSSNPDPPIYKHLNPKTQSLLRQVNAHRQAQEQADNMSTEQTYVAALHACFYACSPEFQWQTSPPYAGTDRFIASLLSSLMASRYALPPILHTHFQSIHF